MTARNGSADWLGDVKTGSGTITVGDGVFSGPYSYDSRFGERQGTNPEQLIAAAQAGCFTMALASKLASAGHAPEQLRTNARVDLRMHDGSITITRLQIETEGRVKGIDERQFVQYAEDAKATCPVARALSGIPEIVLKAKLTESA
jgi:lipoyl-dependent peroxiredoxin